MPVHKCPNGKYRIGSGKCVYDSKAAAERAYKGYLAHKHMHEIGLIKKEFEAIKIEIEKTKKMLGEINDDR